MTGREIKMTEQVKDLLFPKLTPLCVEILLAWGAGLEMENPYQFTIERVRIAKRSELSSAQMAEAVRMVQGKRGRSRKLGYLVRHCERAISEKLGPQGFVVGGTAPGTYKLTPAGQQLTELLHTAIELWFKKGA